MCAWQTVETESLLKPILSAEEIPGELSFKCYALVIGSWSSYLVSLFASLLFYMVMGSVCTRDLQEIFGFNLGARTQTNEKTACSLLLWLANGW